MVDSMTSSECIRILKEEMEGLRCGKLKPTTSLSEMYDALYFAVKQLQKKEAFEKAQIETAYRKGMEDTLRAFLSIEKSKVNEAAFQSPLLILNKNQ